jgi:phosphomannomutase
MAATHGVTAAETFTGFKWIARAVQDHPEHDFVFGYEQALGYLVTDQPLDKDGITAAVLFAEMAAVAASEGQTMQGWLDDIAARYGRHELADAAVRMPPADARARVAELIAAPPDSIGGRAVVATEDFPDAGLLRFELEGGVRVQIRPSGTEPKVKIYGEAVDEDPTPFVTALAALLS